MRGVPVICSDRCGVADLIMAKEVTMEPEQYVSKYKQVCSANFRSIFRHVILSTLATSYKVTGQMSSLLSRNRIQFLYLHHVFEDEENSFRKLLVTLNSKHCFISYSEAVDRIWDGNINRQYVVISFDDGSKNWLRAAQIMNEFGIKACFFPCISMVGETKKQRVLLSWEDIEFLLKKGHEIGGHTVHHPNLAQLSLQQIQDEIMGCFELLTQRIGDVKHFSWPFGRFSHFSPTAAKIVFEAGFKSCASAERGCHVAQSERLSLCIRRDHIIANWPINHILYFMARNCQTASRHSNLWPKGWIEIIQRSAGN